MNINEIYVRHPYTFKGQRSLDLKLFKDEILFKQYTEKNKFFINQTKFIVLNIKNSLHMKYLKNPILYKDVYEEYIATTNQKEHSLKNFNHLKDSFSLELLNKNKILLEEFEYEGKIVYLINDGLHRASIYFYNFEEDLDSKYFEIIKNKYI